jgi:hypothetical protein
MNKILQSLLLVIVVSVAAAARLSLLGWFGFIGIGSVLVLGIAHFYMHFYSMNSLAVPRITNILYIIVSHILFLALFLFQPDADDSRTYIVIDYIMGKSNGRLAGVSTIVLPVSFLLYIIIAVRIVGIARRYAIRGINHVLLITAIISVLVLPLLFMRFMYDRLEREHEVKIEATGEYSDIRRALKNKELVKILRIDSYRDSYKTFPNEILELTNLEELYLNEQKIKVIPDGIRNLKKLKWLEMVDNEIESINPAICECEQLEHIGIGGHIETLPDCLTSLRNLRSLTIQSNTVNELMDELRKFRYLETAHFYTKGKLFDREKWWKLSEELGLK